MKAPEKNLSKTQQPKPREPQSQWPLVTPAQRLNHLSLPSILLYYIHQQALQTSKKSIVLHLNHSCNNPSSDPSVFLKIARLFNDRLSPWSRQTVQLGDQRDAKSQLDYSPQCSNSHYGSHNLKWLSSRILITVSKWPSPWQVLNKTVESVGKKASEWWGTVVTASSAIVTN